MHASIEVKTIASSLSFSCSDITTFFNSQLHLGSFFNSELQTPSHTISISLDLSALLSTSLYIDVYLSYQLYSPITMDSSTAHFLNQTELRLGLPGTYFPEIHQHHHHRRHHCHRHKEAMDDIEKWVFPRTEFLSLSSEEDEESDGNSRVVGWPPIRRSCRKNDTMSKRRVFVKVSMDGVPYLRNVDLNTFCNYRDLWSELQKMFSRFINRKNNNNNISPDVASSEHHIHMHAGRRIDGAGVLGISDYVVTYEDKDGDWMLVGDVPWE